MPRYIFKSQLCTKLSTDNVESFLDIGELFLKSTFLFNKNLQKQYKKLSNLC